MKTVLLSLGANLGDRIATISQAVQLLGERSLLHSMQCSSMYETEPVGFTDQPAFINACVVGECEREPLELRRHLKAVETELGRTPRAKWHEREIDIDILLYGNIVIETGELTVPHKNMHERRFVLVPAAAIAPTLIHPIFQLSMKSLLENCADNSRVTVFEF